MPGCRQKMLQFVNWKMRITISDTREIVGTFMAFDKHMNMILGDSEEFRLVKQEGKKGKDAWVEEKRLLGLLLLRGDAVISVKPVGPPAPAPKYKEKEGGVKVVAALPGQGPLPGMVGPRPGMPMMRPGMPMMRPGMPPMFGRGGPPPQMMGRPGMMPPGGMPRPGMPMPFPGGPPRPGMAMPGRGGPPPQQPQ